MATAKNACPPNDHVSFLEAPTLLPELDWWVEAYIRDRRRFTFTEREVLEPLWREGEEIRLREDSRFQQVKCSHESAETQWKLAQHTLANTLLFEALTQGLWDGYDLFGFLDQLDQQASGSAFHVFAPTDERFLLSQDEHGTPMLTLRATMSLSDDTPEAKQAIDDLLPLVLEHFSQMGQQVWTTVQILEALEAFGEQAQPFGKVTPALLEDRLLQRGSWKRVGIGQWMAEKQLPSLPHRHRYAVQPISVPVGGIKNGVLQQVNEHSPVCDGAQTQEQSSVSQGPSSLGRAVTCRVTLRTAHLNEGRVPVPKEARLRYPYARGLAHVLPFPGLWFTDGTPLIIWLERTRHQLFGQDLLDHFAFLQAGTILKVIWAPAGITFQIEGVDAQVTEEEIRLVDLTSLAELRSATLESYRASLRAILSEQQALGFRELYQALCRRQQHTPNSASIRTILSSSPEFVYIKSEGKWSLCPPVSAQEGAKVLRRSILVAHQPQGKQHSSQQGVNQYSLSEMIARNREHLRTLRALYPSLPQ